jgi:hypothetical protein
MTWLGDGKASRLVKSCGGKGGSAPYSLLGGVPRAGDGELLVPKLECPKDQLLRLDLPGHPFDKVGFCDAASARADLAGSLALDIEDGCEPDEIEFKREILGLLDLALEHRLVFGINFDG